MRSILLFLMLLGAWTSHLLAQPTQETISLNPGYADQVWYSLDQGETARASAYEWHLAFEVANFGFSIRVNNARGVECYAYPGPVSDFETLDTTHIGQWPTLINSDTSWSYGALSRYQSGFDIGWGNYNLTTHTIAGDSLYVLRLPSGEVFKLFVEKLVGGTYTYRYATIDNSTDVTTTVTKGDFPDKRFVYVNLLTQQTLDREPVLSNWDLLFTTYITAIQAGPTKVAYPVSGILHREGVEVAEAYPVPDPSSYSDYTAHAFAHEINTIGYDWKSFAGTWTLQDSLVYFVKLENGNIWKLRFTAFGGSSTGDFTFEKEPVVVTGVEETTTNPLVQLYPNPARDVLHLVLDQPAATPYQLQVVNTQGQVVHHQLLDQQGLTTYTLPVADLPSGMYWLHGRSEDGAFTQSFVKP